MSDVIRAAAAATKTQEGMFEVLSPEGYSELDIIAPTAPLASLDNKTVGFVWDYLFKGDEVFEILGAGLQAQYENLRVVPHEHFGNIHGPAEAQIMNDLAGAAQAAGCDAMIVGMGC
jgi:hypothetical protein